VRGLRRRIGALVVLLALAGCSENAAKGGLIGAAGGALVGAATSGGRNAGLGALIGGLVGALAGEVVTQRQAVVAAANPPPPPPPGPPGTPPLPGPVTPPPPAVSGVPATSWSVVTAPTPPPPVGPPSEGAGTQPPDPTRGVISNATLWEIHVFLDQPPGSASPIVLKPGDSLPAVLDIGQHRVVAQAFVDTQLGRRTVGTFDQILTVDARAPGWTIHFFPANF
jgi:YMGG-like Gly-zipper